MSDPVDCLHTGGARSARVVAEDLTPCRPHNCLRHKQTDDLRGHDPAAPCLWRSITQSLPEQAVHIFLSNTVMPSPTASKSAGYFEGLSASLQSSTSLDTLSGALEAVALASFANRFHAQEARLMAMEQYSHAISRLRSTAFNFGTEVSSLITSITLLTLYEVIDASATGGFIWLRHLRGLVTVMTKLVQMNRMPAAGIPALVVGTELFPDTHDQHFLTRCVAGRSDWKESHPSTPAFHRLFAILRRVQTLFRKSTTTLDQHWISYELNLRELQREALALKAELVLWSSSQSGANGYTTTEYFTQSYTLKFPGAQDLLCQAKRADTYVDYFVACLWISYRQCMLHLIDLLDRVNRSLKPDPAEYVKSREHKKNSDEVRVLVHDVCASIPFMLVGTSIGRTKPDGSVWLQAQPPMLIGGLNLQWILFTISILEIVDTGIKADMKSSLAWIGQNLGIGQATMLAQMDKNPPGGLTAKGDVLKWIGFLI